MARSVRAFVRGSTDWFYEWLKEMKVDVIPQGPAIWIGGDCHIGNLGPVGNALGKVDVQIRDLDHTVIGNPAHDLIRLGLSLASAARDSVLSGVITAQMVEQLLEGYESCFGEKRDEARKSASPDTVKVTIKEAAKRSWKDLAKERLKTRRHTFRWERRSGRFQEKKERLSSKSSRSKIFFVISLSRTPQMKTPRSEFRCRVLGKGLQFAGKSALCHSPRRSNTQEIPLPDRHQRSGRCRCAQAARRKDANGEWRTWCRGCAPPVALSW